MTRLIIQSIAFSARPPGFFLLLQIRRPTWRGGRELGSDRKKELIALEGGLKFDRESGKNDSFAFASTCFLKAKFQAVRLFLDVYILYF